MSFKNYLSSFTIVSLQYFWVDLSVFHRLAEIKFTYSQEPSGTRLEDKIFISKQSADLPEPPGIFHCPETDRSSVRIQIPKPEPEKKEY